MNFKRRHLDEGQRAAVAAQIANMTEGRPKQTGHICPVSTEEAARLLNVSTSTVKNAKVVLKRGTAEEIEPMKALVPGERQQHGQDDANACRDEGADQSRHLRVAADARRARRRRAAATIVSAGHAVRQPARKSIATIAKAVEVQENRKPRANPFITRPLDRVRLGVSPSRQNGRDRSVTPYPWSKARDGSR